MSGGGSSVGGSRGSQQQFDLHQGTGDEDGPRFVLGRKYGSGERKMLPMRQCSILTIFVVPIQCRGGGRMDASLSISSVVHLSDRISCHEPLQPY